MAKNCGSKKADNPDEGAAFAASQVTDGGALRVELPRWYSSPFSRPKLTRRLAGV
jgi:hypothetical protein